jgi:hypothetical protein
MENNEIGLIFVNYLSCCVDGILRVGFYIINIFDKIFFFKYINLFDWVIIYFWILLNKIFTKNIYLVLILFKRKKIIFINKLIY